MLIINDGTLYFLEQLAVAGGMNHASLTGAVPETIMIGVPQNGTDSYSQTDTLTHSLKSASNGAVQSPLLSQCMLITMPPFQ